MSKGLSSYPEHQRVAVAERRVRNQARGNGYWGAMDFLDSQKAKSLKKKDIKDLTKKELQDAVELHNKGKL
jgi:hypothetical protein